MKESKGICATEWGWYGLFAALGVFAAGFGVWRSLSEFTQDAFMLVIAGIYAFCWGAYHVIEQQYLDEDGITIRRFGKSVRFLDWRDVAQVHKIHRQSVSVKSSGYDVLMVTPAGCPEYRYGVSCNEHLASCGQAIVLDDSKKIRAYIEQVWGKITVLNAKGQPFEEPKR